MRGCQHLDRGDSALQGQTGGLSGCIISVSGRCCHCHWERHGGLDCDAQAGGDGSGNPLQKVTRHVRGRVGAGNIQGSKVSHHADSAVLQQAPTVALTFPSASVAGAVAVTEVAVTSRSWALPKGDADTLDAVRSGGEGCAGRRRKPDVVGASVLYWSRGLRTADGVRVCRVDLLSELRGALSVITVSCGSGESWALGRGGDRGEFGQFDEGVQAGTRASRDPPPFP